MSGIEPSQTVNQALLNLPHILQHQTDFTEVSRIITQQALQIFHAQYAAISMVNPETTKTMKTIYQQDASDGNDDQVNLLILMLSGWAMEHEKILVSHHIARDDRFPGVDETLAGTFSGVSIPLAYLNHMIGTITFLYESAPAHDLINNELCDIFGSIISPYLSDTQKIQEFFTPPQSTHVLIEKYQSIGMIGQSTQYLQLLRDVEAASKSNVRVLLEGETGTGKELVAHAIHRFSKRRDAPFIPVDCGAIPANLVESELFGHVKGSFTHAESDRAGLIQSADQGVLFLDEIGNLTEQVQVKLLRVLQEGKVRPIGSDVMKPVDVRIIAASSSPLQKRVEEGTFREDLFYRLYVYPIRVPSLRERQTDIPALAHHFLQIFADQYSKSVQEIAEPVLESLTRKLWKGNIRQLENFIERLVTIIPAGERTITAELLPGRILDEIGISSGHSSGGQHEKKSLRYQIDEYEKELILQALQQTSWNQVEAAQLLQIPESVLRYKMKKFNIHK